MLQSVRWFLACCLMGIFCCDAVLLAQNNAASPADLWDDFNHYVLIARPDLAAASGEALLEQVDAQELLDVVEASDFADYVRVLDRAERIEDVAPVAQALHEQILAAGVTRSRDPERIADDIQQLAEGRRPAHEALTRLRAAGQYAAPQLLAVLEDDRARAMHPVVSQAMEQIGRSMVMPLSAAITEVEPATMGRLAQILAQIGYPQALPPIRELLERDDLNEATRTRLQQAYDQLLLETGVPDNLTAAQLYLSLGVSQFDQGTRGQQPLGFDDKEDVGVIWTYAEELIPIPVPAEIYADVLAMRSAMDALALNPNLDQALSLQLTSNFRREIRLPEGEVDPSYPSGMKPAAFYAMIAGPVRLHDVLKTALETQDVPLAMAAIEALGATAGTNALVNVGAGQQPLIEAISYPDRRVRFNAALVLANARPRSDYAGAFRVVSVLSEAIRQGDRQIAVALANTDDRVNALQSMIAGMDYDVLAGSSVLALDEAIQAMPGVDLIVIESDAEGVKRVVRNANADYKLANVPIVAIVSRGDQLELAELVQRTPRLTLVLPTDDATALGEEVAGAIEQYEGQAITAEEADVFALSALDSLEQIAMGSDVYNAQDAQTALIDALRDSRDSVAIGAARVLALFDDAQAQQAIADAAFDASGARQIDLLENLAFSATRFGNLLQESQIENLLTLVDETDGDLAIAAARAHGALTLPTANSVRLMLDQ